MNMEKESQFNEEIEKQQEQEPEVETVESLKRKLEQVMAELEQIKAENAKLEDESIYDDLTGLKNRKFFTKKNKEDISRISAPEGQERREKANLECIGFLFCDIDNFKEINDTFGHPAGDEILKAIARILEENTRESDTVGRWAGDEMVVSLLGANEEEAAMKAEELRKEIEKVAEQYPQYAGLKTSLSIGVSSFEKGLTFDELIYRGDKAVYLAKQEKNCVRTHSDVLEREQNKEKGEVA